MEESPWLATLAARLHCCAGVTVQNDSFGADGYTRRLRDISRRVCDPTSCCAECGGGWLGADSLPDRIREPRRWRGATLDRAYRVPGQGVLLDGAVALMRIGLSVSKVKVRVSRCEGRVWSPTTNRYRANRCSRSSTRSRQSQGHLRRAQLRPGAERPGGPRQLRRLSRTAVRDRLLPMQFPLILQLDCSVPEFPIRELERLSAQRQGRPNRQTLCNPRRRAR